MRLARAVTLAAVAVLVLCRPVGAQTVSPATGVITGTVRDSTGASLRDVTVTISSDALMSPRVIVTHERGTFTFGALTPGTYSLDLSLPGFARASRPHILLTSGFTATVDVVMSLASVVEHAAVETSAAIDRSGTSLGTTFGAMQLANLPGSRSMGAVLAATPGVYVSRFDVGGSSPDTGQYGAYGTQGFNRPMVEGICIAGIMSTGMGLDLGSFDEVSVGTGAHSPEWNSAGVQMQFLSKSGGNQYRGSASLDYGHRDWQATNIDAGQVARGAGTGADPRTSNQLWSYRDLNADIGGYVVPDLVWWYASARDHEIQAQQVNFPARPQQARLTNYTGKVTVGLARGHSLVGYLQAGRTLTPYRLEPFGPAGGPLSASSVLHTSEASTTRQDGWGWIGKVEWNATLGSSTYLELRAGQFGANRSEVPNGTGPRFEDLGSLQVRGASRDWEDQFRRSQILGTFSRLKTGWIGEHHFKVGGEIFLTTEAEIWRRGYGDDVLHVTHNGSPAEVYLFEAPSWSESGLWTYGAFLQDSWKPTRRLTLNLGLRFDRYRVFLPAQSHPAGRFNAVAQFFEADHNVAAWNELVPRLGATYDISEDGRTVLKASFSRFSLPPGTVIGFNANANAPVWWKRYEWRDLNANGVWDPGEQRGNPLAERGGAAVESLDDSLELPTVTEAAGWVERELPAHVMVRTGVVWRSGQDYFLRVNANRPFSAFTEPIALFDPGPDGLDGTADDGAAVLGWDIPANTDAPRAANVVANVPGARSRHWTWELVAQRRFAGRWSLLGGVAHVWNGDQASTYTGQSVRQNAFPVTPNDLIQTGADGRYDFRTWTAKLHAVIDGPWGLRASPLVRHQSGQPFGRTFVRRTRAGNVRILAEPIDTRRMDHITLVDLRVEKGFRFGSSRRVGVFVDVYNVFNANPEPNINWSSGPSFLQPLAIVPPRIARLGAKIDW
jgi:outer membrane receptor protein involved in Fe transport